MTRKYICPACGEKTGVNIVYGYPTIEARDARDLGEIILGGCCAAVSSVVMSGILSAVSLTHWQGMKVRDCLALIRDETLSGESENKVRAYQAIVNSDKHHHLTDKERRYLDKLIKWGMVQPKGYSRLPLD